MIRELVLIIVSVLISFEAIAESCQCAPTICGPCEEVTGSTFYTSSCEGGRTKSCQKATCELSKTKECEQHLIKQKQSQKQSETVTPVQNSETKKPVGTFAIVRGDVRVLSRGLESSVKIGSLLYEKDVVIIDAKTVAKVVMEDNNVLHIGPNSRIKIRGYESADDKGYSSATVDLIFGKIRSQVVTRPKYPDKPIFKIRTPAAVANVKGTDFIVTHTKGGDITKVETLKGVVDLGSHDRADKVVVKKGSYASYVILASNTPQSVNDDDIGSFIHKGFLTPIYQMSADQIERLDIETEYREDGSDRVIAESDAPSPICQSPRGDLNQCAWTCANNPAGAKTCRTDLSNVRCVRSRCDANGRWSGEERLPASQSGRCGSEVSVGPCDY